MGKNILNEKGISFNQIEKEIFKRKCEEAAMETRDLLERCDDLIAEERDKKKYRNKGKRTTTIKTVYGDVTYRRRVYQTTTDEGLKAYVYLLDEEMGMEKIGLISTNLGEKIAATVIQDSFRVTSERITDTCGQSISHSGAWNFTQRLGEKMTEEDEAAVSDMNAGNIKGERAVPVLFEEMDGLWLDMQGKGARKVPGRELKMSTIYEGWDASSKKASKLIEKTVFAGMERSEDFLEKREAKICQKYDPEKIGQRILNGDGGGWIKDPYEPKTIEQTDRYHVVKEIRSKIADEEYQRMLQKLLRGDNIEELIEQVQIYADSVATDDENDDREEKALELKRYLKNQNEKLRRYDNRGIDIPKAPEGIVYKYLGTQENQNATVAAGRMKHGRRRWSVKGAHNMAQLLCHSENGDLIAAVNRFTDRYLPDSMIETEILSVAKSPRVDGKGNNPYVDRFGCHLPILDSSNSRSVKMFKGLIW